MTRVPIVFPVIPVPKPRQTRSDKWKQRPCVMRYRAFADEMRRHAKHYGFTLPESGATILFSLPMPPSWSAKKKALMHGQPHRQKPDLDNMIKATIDALCAEDSGIWHIAGAQKNWSNTGSITFLVERAN